VLAAATLLDRSGPAEAECNRRMLQPVLRRELIKYTSHVEVHGFFFECPSGSRILMLVSGAGAASCELPLVSVSEAALMCWSPVSGAALLLPKSLAVGLGHNVRGAAKKK
jgi:hypothetical protein